MANVVRMANSGTKVLVDHQVKTVNLGHQAVKVHLAHLV